MSIDYIVRGEVTKERIPEMEDHVRWLGELDENEQKAVSQVLEGVRMSMTNKEQHKGQGK